MSAHLASLKATAHEWSTSVASAISSSIAEHPQRWGIGAIAASSLALLSQTDLGIRIMSSLIPSSLQPASWRTARIARMGERYFQVLSELWSRLPDAPIHPVTGIPRDSQGHVRLLEYVATAGLSRWSDQTPTKEQAEERLAELMATDLFMIEATDADMTEWATRWTMWPDWDEKRHWTADDVSFAINSVHEARYSTVGRAVQDGIDRLIAVSSAQRGLEMPRTMAWHAAHGHFPPSAHAGDAVRADGSDYDARSEHSSRCY